MAERASACTALAGRRLHGVHEPPHRHPARLVHQNALMITVALTCTLLFSSTTIDHSVVQQRAAGLSRDLAITSTGLWTAGCEAGRRGRRSRSALGGRSDPTTLGPSLGVADDTISAVVLTGGQAAGRRRRDRRIVAALHRDTIALGRPLADAARAWIGDRIRLRSGNPVQRRFSPTASAVLAWLERRKSTAAALLVSPGGSSPDGRPSQAVGLPRTNSAVPEAGLRQAACGPAGRRGSHGSPERPLRRPCGHRSLRWDVPDQRTAASA
jgi:hypothetical protein